MLILDVMVTVRVVDELRAKGNQAGLKAAQGICIVKGEELFTPLRQGCRCFQQTFMNFRPEPGLTANRSAVKILLKRLYRLGYQRGELFAFFNMKSI